MSGISNLGQALDQIARIKTQQGRMDFFSTQIATGKKTQQFSGLGTDILRSQRARADINALEQYSANITNGHRRLQLMTGSIQQMASQANLLSNSLTVAMQGGDNPDFETTQQLATDVYDFIVDLINTKDGDRYLFAGSDSSIKPLDDEELFKSFLGTNEFDDDLVTTRISNGLIGDWADTTITTEEFIASYKNTSEHILGYSESLSSGTAGEVRIRVDENSDFNYTLLGNSSAMKDLIISLGVLKNMPPPEFSPGALNEQVLPNTALESGSWPPQEKQDNFYAVINDLAETIVKAVDQLERDEYRLSLVEAQTQSIQEQYIYQKSSYESIIAEIENVDLTETIVRIQQVQIGLEASFSVTALISNLSLVNFLK